MKSIVWFRNDLRLSDNPALTEACREGGSVIPVYILPKSESGSLGDASRVWLHHSLTELSQAIEERQGKLCVFSGDPLELLTELSKETGATRVYWNRNYDPYSVSLGNAIKIGLRKEGIQGISFNGNLLVEPWQIKNKSGEPYRVFTPYWKAVRPQYLEMNAPTKAPKTIRFESVTGTKGDLDGLGLRSGKKWESRLIAHWTPGEEGAKRALNQFGKDSILEYPSQRDVPATRGTSRLSPYLHFGEISPKQILAKVGLNPDSESFIRQLAWREFAHSLLYYFPKTPNEPLNPQFLDFKWKQDPIAFEKWSRGQTGFPIVDAGMRELWETGWMHNRVRMIVASFLVKDLLIPWQDGAQWFWDTLVDADTANNTMGWQWVAGCGADAAPYFRVFNPELQGKKFDPEGDYVRRWVPELAKIPAKHIHKPAGLDTQVLESMGVRLGDNYPLPIVDHSQARQRALAAYDAIK